MSEFKFACPVCGQHIKCDSAKSGTQVDCPTCFQSLIVPDAPRGDISGLILNAALANSRRFAPEDTKTQTSAGQPPSSAKFPMAVVLIVIIFGTVALFAFFAFRGKHFKPKPQGVGQSHPAGPSTFLAAPLVNDTNWTLQLSGVTIPESPAAGRIHGRIFFQPRVTLEGGTLYFRQGDARPPDLGLMIYLPVKEAWELSGKSYGIGTNDTQAARVTLRWKDDQNQPERQSFNSGYALRLDFGRHSGDFLQGRIYFCAPDEEKSYVAGTFVAEILKPSPSRPKRPRR